MPEVTDKYVRIPFTKGHSGKGHRLRTITISDAKGIKAIYCGTHKVIKTYLFSTERWTMASAKKWVQAHKDGGKSMELDAVEIDGKEVLIEDLIEAYKTSEDVKDDGEREKAKKAQKARSKKYGIAVREDGNVAKPTEWADVPDSQFADPVNYSYPCPDAEQTQAALRYWGKAKNKAKYSSEDQAIVTARLKKFAKKFKVGEFADKSLDDLSLDAQTRQVRDAWYEYAQPPGAPKPGAPYPKEVYEDHIIVETLEGLHKYPYSVADDGAITFGKPVKVELTYKPVPEGKSLSFGARISVVRDTFEQLSRPPKVPMTEAVSEHLWIDSDDIFDDYIIAKPGKKDAYKVPYTMDEDDNVEFAAQDKWEKVEHEWVPSKAMNYCIKRLGETDDGWFVGGYGMIWGSGQQRDLSPWPNADGSKGEFFTPQTQGLDDLPIKVITFEHDKEKAPDGEPFRHVLGTTVLERDDAIGRWVEALVEKRRKYAGYVVDLIDQQLLNFSSETASHWREVADDGEIKMWRTAGYTTTTHPMEPRLTDVNRLKAYYKSLDLDLAEPDTGGAGEEPGLKTEKAIAEIELLLLDIDMEEKT